LIVSAGVVGLAFSFYQYTLIARTTIKPQPTSESSSLRMLDPKITETLFEVYTAISEGAETFLHSEYKICGAFVVCFAGLLFALISMAASVEVRERASCALRQTDAGCALWCQCRTL
jgi:inorganic pyrophosphatase